MKRKATITIYTEVLPDAIEGVAVQPTSQEDYVILLNSDLEAEDQKKALIHEVLHIWNGDLQKPNVSQIEHAREADTEYYYLQATQEEHTLT